MTTGGHNFIDLTGRRFGRLVVLSRGPNVNNTIATWNCRCDCGKDKNIRGLKLKAGVTTSCGCFRREVVARKNTTHGESNNNSYGSWQAMLTRCSNKNQRSYKNYGGRGITVCQEWLSFENFLADMGERPEGMSLERIDNEQGYNKLNCKWATRQEQSRNKRTNRYITINGITLCFSDMCKKFSIDRDIVRDRLRSGWPEIEAFTTPVYGEVSSQT